MKRASVTETNREESRAGVRQRRVDRNGQRVRVAACAVGFSEAEWCERPHVGYVLRGVLDVESATGVDRFSAGDMLFIGEQERASKSQS
jgi:hypothetical protein